MPIQFSFSGDDALNYENYLGPLMFEPASRVFISYLPAINCNDVLEIACGSGRLTRHLRNYLPDTARLIATDISPDMLAQAKIQLPGSDIEFELADAQNLPFADNSFDLIVCQFGMMFLPDKKKGFAEIHRVLKPGGHFVFSTWNDSAQIPLIRIVIEETVIPFFNFEEPDRFRTPFSMHNPASLEGFLKTAGFGNLQIDTVTFAAGPSTPKEVVDAFIIKHPLGRAIAEKDAAAPVTLSAKLVDQITNSFGTPIKADLSAIFSSAQKPRPLIYKN